MEPLVSVVVPTTDRSEGFLRCLKSALNQSYKNIEVIVIGNNYSCNNTIPALINGLCDERIKYFYLKNCSNANVARNYGVDISKGSYVAFLDSDDYWDHEHICSNLDLALHGALAIYSGFILDNGKFSKIIQSRPFKLGESGYDFLFGRDSGVAQTSSYFLDRKVFVTCRWDETLKRNQDYDFFVRVKDFCGWTYKNNITSSVFWGQGVVRKYDFHSFINFYDKHSPCMNETNIAYYLFDVVRAMIVSGNIDGYKYFYRKIVLFTTFLPFYKRFVISNYFLGRLLFSCKKNF